MLVWRCAQVVPRIHMANAPKPALFKEAKVVRSCSKLFGADFGRAPEEAYEDSLNFWDRFGSASTGWLPMGIRVCPPSMRCVVPFTSARLCSSNLDFHLRYVPKTFHAPGKWFSHLRSSSAGAISLPMHTRHRVQSEQGPGRRIFLSGRDGG